jgi:mRNA interferase RelE/StbE
MYSIVYTREAKHALDNLSIKKKRQIKDALERIVGNPRLGKRLIQELSGLWSYRSGDYRIIYKVEHQQVLIIVLAIGTRRDIYNKLSRKKQ